MSKYFDVWESAMRVLRDPEFPGEVALYPIEDFQLIGFLILTSPTLGAALERGIRFQRVWFTAGGWTLQHEQDCTWVTFGPLVHNAAGAFELGERCAYECAVTAMVRGIERLAGLSCIEEVEVAHNLPPQGKPHHMHTWPQTFFGTGAYKLRLRKGATETPIAGANAAMSNYFLERCEDILRAKTETTTIAERVRGQLILMFRELVQGQITSAEAGEPQLATVAKRLSMSERTLQRELSGEGVSFRALLDELRAELAQAHLRDPRTTVAEAAYLTGFESVSAFSRAFRRWTGRPPRRAPAAS